MRVIALSALLAVHVVAGCASDATPDGDEIEVDDAKADGAARPLGTFETNNHGASEFNRIVLESNKTFNALVGGGGDIGGTYKFTSSNGGANHYIRFTDSDSGELIARCRYTFEGDVLHVYPATVSGDAVTCDDSTLTRAETAWCDTEDDCSVQGLAEPTCDGSVQWTCDSGCSASCSSTAPQSEACTRLEAEFDPCLGEHAEGCFDIYDADIQTCCYDENSPSQTCVDIREHLGA